MHIPNDTSPVTQSPTTDKIMILINLRYVQVVQEEANKTKSQYAGASARNIFTICAHSFETAFCGAPGQYVFHLLDRHFAEDRASKCDLE